MKSRRSVVLIVLLLFFTYARVEKVNCHYAWLNINPDLVMQGGEFEIRYNISKFYMLPTGGVVVAKRQMREINIFLEIPEGLNCTIESLEVSGNGSITKEINGLNAIVRASIDIGTLNLVAKVRVPLDYEVGTYNIRVDARAREVDENGEEFYPVDYSTSENIEIKTFGPIFSIRPEPKEVEPPHTVGIVVTIMHKEPVPPFDITNLTLKVIPPPPNKPKVIPLVDIFGRSFLRPGRSVKFPRPIYVEIDEKTAGGIREIRAELEFWVSGMKKVIEARTNITVIKTTEVNISAEVPSKVVNGSELRLSLEVVNVGSFIAKNVIVLGELSGEKSVVNVGSLEPGQFKDLELALPVRGAGNETLLLKVYWNNEYPYEQVSNSLKFTVLVTKGRFNTRTVLAIGSVVLVFAMGWLIGKKAIKHSAS